MPKGKKAKGGKKGKAKKGKKSKDGVSIASLAEANARIWEYRLNKVEESRNEYREAARQLAMSQSNMNTQMQLNERDTIDVITYLKKQDLSKDEKIDHLQHQLNEVKRVAREEREKMVNMYEKQISALEEGLSQRNTDVQMMQNELKMVKEFRRKRGQITKELEEIREDMYMSNKQHKTTLQRMEQKFFEEKVRLQQEANEKIAELAERAHTEAIQNLDENTRSVYKENVRLQESLSLHMKSEEKYKKYNNALQEKAEKLIDSRELNDVLVEEKIIEAKRQKNHIKKLNAKIHTLEESLAQVIREFEKDKEDSSKRMFMELVSSKQEIDRLQRALDLRTKECVKVKRLARNIIEQRSELEQFFLESLEDVRGEIKSSQLEFTKESKKVYQQQMIAAYAQHADYPKVRTFDKNDHSTNNVFKDMKEAENWAHVSKRVDIADLTWEQKERVLRFLFAKINGYKEKKHTDLMPQHKEPNSPPVTVNEEPSLTFLTQADGALTVESNQTLPQDQKSIVVADPNKNEAENFKEKNTAPEKNIDKNAPHSDENNSQLADTSKVVQPSTTANTTEDQNSSNQPDAAPNSENRDKDHSNADPPPVEENK